MIEQTVSERVLHCLSTLPPTLAATDLQAAELSLSQALGAYSVRIVLQGLAADGGIFGVPLQIQDEMLGRMLIDWGEQVVSEQMRGLCQQAAMEIALRVRSAAQLQALRVLRSEMARKEFNLYTVYQVSKSLSSVLDLNEVLTHLTDMIAEVMTVRACYVLLQSEDQDQLHVHGYKIPLEDVPPPPNLELLMTDRVPEWLTTLGGESQPIMDFEDPAFLAAFPNAAEQLRAVSVSLVMPMLHKGRLAGLLALDAKCNGAPFEPRDMEFLSILAPLAANALTNAQLYEQAILDGLTRLYVVRYFRQRCREELKRARRYRSALSLIMLDVDHFKSVNDVNGHLVGDRVLREIAKLIKSSTRVDVDIVARYGGEEFVVLLPETAHAGAMIMAERVRRKVEEAPLTSKHLHVTVSGGVASFVGDESDYVELIARADDALLRAKKQGRNRICVAESRLLHQGQTPVG